jgi:hypothetical protein
MVELRRVPLCFSNLCFKLKMIQLFFSLLCLLHAAYIAAAAGLGTVTFSNTRRYIFDVDGNQIDAVAGKLSCIPHLYRRVYNCRC